MRLAVAAGVLHRSDAWLIWATHFDDVTLAAAARSLGISYQAAWARRHRAERRWAGLATRRRAAELGGWFDRSEHWGRDRIAECRADDANGGLAVAAAF